MKKTKNTIFPLMVAILVVLIFIGCQEDPVGVTDIDTGLPEITAISSGVDKMLAGGETDVAVTAKQGSSYKWSADAGSFADASSAMTTWSSEGISESVAIQLVCIVSNGSGSRQASVTVQVVFSTTPVFHWPFDSDFTESMADNNGVAGSGVSINTADPKLGAGCASFPGGDALSADIVMGITDNEGLALDDFFTLVLWMKTTSEHGAILGKVPELNEWDWDGSKNLQTNGDYGFFGYNAQGWRTAVAGEELGENDGEWHMIAVTHFADEDLYELYFDGELVSDGGVPYGETQPDEDNVFYVGGTEWPGPWEGLVDDLKYYDVILSPAEIGLLALAE